MFVRYFAYVDRPCEVCRDELARSSRWIGRVAESASAATHELMRRADGPEVGLPIQIELGNPVVIGDRVQLPISLWGIALAGASPSLSGELQLVPLGRARTKVALSALYEFPSGEGGRWLNTSLLQTIAEATLKDLVDGIARHLARSEGACRRPA